MKQDAFCRAYLRTMDPERAGAETGTDGFALLGNRSVRGRLDRMRETAAGEITREDAVRRLAQLAFGRVNEAAAMALRPGEADPMTLDLSAVAELKVTDKGGVELKFIDRVRALEALCNLLEENSGGAEELLRALEEPDDAR